MTPHPPHPILPPPRHRRILQGLLRTKEELATFSDLKSFLKGFLLVNGNDTGLIQLLVLLRGGRRDAEGGTADLWQSQDMTETQSQGASSATTESLSFRIEMAEPGQVKDVDED